MPGALAAVGLATAVTAVFDSSVATVEVSDLLDVIQPFRVPTPSASWRAWASSARSSPLTPDRLGGGSLFSAARGVDRLHNGPRTEYNKELMAQGAGNTVCDLLGALPMTRHRAQFRQRERGARGPRRPGPAHGAWLLLFAVALLPSVPVLIPLPALAGIPVHAGWKLIPFRGIMSLWRGHRGEGADPGGHGRVDRRGQHVRGRADRSGAVRGQDRLGGFPPQAGGRRQGRRSIQAHLSGNATSCGCRRSWRASRRCCRTARSSWTCPGCTPGPRLPHRAGELGRAAQRHRHGPGEGHRTGHGGR
ncbi:hypothetical protein LV779_10435 [Streptomyces thinghirensis]|nr:hypothetical protein [Streptomyces thinghirensis]